METADANPDDVWTLDLFKGGCDLNQKIGAPGLNNELIAGQRRANKVGECTLRQTVISFSRPTSIAVQMTIGPTGRAGRNE